MPTVLVGGTEQIVNDLERRRAEYGISYIVVRDGHLAHAAQVVQRLAAAR